MMYISLDEFDAVITQFDGVSSMLKHYMYENNELKKALIFSGKILSTTSTYKTMEGKVELLEEELKGLRENVNGLQDILLENKNMLADIKRLETHNANLTDQVKTLKDNNKDLKTNVYFQVDNVKRLEGMLSDEKEKYQFLEARAEEISKRSNECLREITSIRRLEVLRGIRAARFMDIMELNHEDADLILSVVNRFFRNTEVDKNGVFNLVEYLFQRHKMCMENLHMKYCAQAEALRKNPELPFDRAERMPFFR